METYRARRLKNDRFDSLSEEGKSEYLKALDQQIACLSQLPNQKAALEIDSIIEKLHQGDHRFSWTGIYRLSGNELRLVCYRGPYSPHSVIPLEGGICGAAIREATTLNIPDVKADPR
jgi:L-methionine (R)-S-oxide reductase